jgi:hypothetical protein
MVKLPSAQPSNPVVTGSGTCALAAPIAMLAPKRPERELINGDSPLMSSNPAFTTATGAAVPSPHHD